MTDDFVNPGPDHPLRVNQSPATPEPAPKWEPSTDLERAVADFIVAMTPPHQKGGHMDVPTIEMRKDHLRDRLIAFVQEQLAKKEGTANA